MYILVLDQHWIVYHLNKLIQVIRTCLLSQTIFEIVFNNIESACRTQIWSRILQLFYRNDKHIGMTCRVQHFGCYLEGQGHSMTLQQNQVRCLKSHFKTTSQKWSPYWDDVSRTTFGSLPQNSRSQHDLAAKNGSGP